MPAGRRGSGLCFWWTTMDLTALIYESITRNGALTMACGFPGETVCLSSPEGIGSYFSEESFGKTRFIWNPKELS